MKRKIVPIIISYLCVSSFLVNNTSYAAESIYSESLNAIYNTDVSMTTEDPKIFQNDSILEDKDFIPGSVIVVIKKEYSGLNKLFSNLNFPGVNIETIEYLTPLTDDINNTLINYSEYRQVLSLVLSDKSEQGVLNAIEILEYNAIVKEAMPNYIHSDDYDINQVSTTDFSTSLYSTTGAYTSYIDKIQLLDAWELTEGVSDVKVGIVETGGMVEHSAISNNVIWGLDGNTNTAVRFVESDGIDCHATAVAGIVGGTKSVENDYYPICPNVSLVPLTTYVGYNGNSNTLTAMTRVITYAQTNNIPILNCSFGCREEYLSIFENYNGLLVCSAGNDGTDNDIEEHFPSGYDFENIISVANYNTANDSLNTNSNYGINTVDLAAPGTDIILLGIDNDYFINHGTSYAAPMVSGTAALLKSYNPDMSATQMKYAILNNVDVISSLQGKVLTSGRLNVYKAVSSVMEERVKNYAVRYAFKGNNVGLSFVNLDLSYNNNVLRLHSYEQGSAYADNKSQSLTDTDGLINYRTGSFVVPNEEGTIVTLRFNSPFENENPLTSFNTDSLGVSTRDNSIGTLSFYCYKALLGDVDLNGTVEAADGNSILNYVVKLETYTESQKLAADVNGDGEITSLDANLVIGYALGNTNSFY